MARIVITGANGQLGRELVRYFVPTDTVLALDLPTFDITDPEAVKRSVSDFAPDLIINAAAYTDVEKAENDTELAERVNHIGARYVAEAAAAADAWVLYYSTDYVFDGLQKEPYGEGTPIDEQIPLNAYGRTKWLGEEATRMATPKHLILRTAWLYGPGGNNFVEKILTAARNRPVLRVVWDEVGCPTHTFDLAEATEVLWRTGISGTYHVVNEGNCSRFEWAGAVLSLAGIDTPVQPCLASEYPMKARRPVRSVLSTDKYTLVSGRRLRPWRDALKHYLERREIVQ